MDPDAEKFPETRKRPLDWAAGSVWVTRAIEQSFESRATALLGWGGERLGREGVEKAGIDRALEFSVGGVEKRGGGRARASFPFFFFGRSNQGGRERLVAPEGSKGRAAGGGCPRSRGGRSPRGRGCGGVCQFGDWKMREILSDGFSFSH